MTPRRTALLAGVAAAVVLVDQATKTWAENALVDGPRHLFWTFQLNYTLNPGMAFSFAHGLTPFITAAGVVLVIGLLGLSRTTTTVLGIVALGLIVGGAAGNLVDRLVRDNNGAVIDFVDAQWWPVFNVADASLVIGATLLVISQRHRPAPARTS